MTAMLLIEWTAGLSVSVPSIDEQHKKLVNMINALNSAMEDGRTDDVLQKILEGLLVYADKHFEYEEEIFARTGYPQTADHVAEHDALRERALSMKGRLDRGEPLLGEHLLSFLREWLTNHILVTDKQYSQHMIQHGVR